MTFTDLVPGDVVFVDSNIFVYHFAPDPVLQVPCGQFLRRIENQEIQHLRLRMSWRKPLTAC
jgi:predicted nucleic acid-binding protein